MKSFWKQLTMVGIVLAAATAWASDLTLHLNGSDPMTPHTVRFECDAVGTQMGLPAGTFSVQYINGNGNSLAVVPVGGKTLIFANIVDGSNGSRYMAGIYTWWDAGDRGTTFSSNMIGGNKQASCHQVKGQ